jgi:hypothetical protein
MKAAKQNKKIEVAEDQGAFARTFGISSIVTSFPFLTNQPSNLEMMTTTKLSIYERDCGTNSHLVTFGGGADPVFKAINP